MNREGKMLYYPRGESGKAFPGTCLKKAQALGNRFCLFIAADGNLIFFLMKFWINLKMDLDSELSLHMIEKIAFFLEDEVVNGGMHLNGDGIAFNIVARLTLNGSDQFITYRRG